MRGASRIYFVMVICLFSTAVLCWWVELFTATFRRVQRFCATCEVLRVQPNLAMLGQVYTALLSRFFVAALCWWVELFTTTFRRVQRVYAIGDVLRLQPNLAILGQEIEYTMISFWFVGEAVTVHHRQQFCPPSVIF